MAVSLSSTYTGRVVAANAKGIRLEDHDDWLNYSKFAADVILPERGDVVTVTVDSKGFIRTLQPLDGSASTNGAERVRIDAQGRSAPHSTPDSVGRSGQASQREATITRLAVLKAAAEFGASRAELKSGDVLRIADVWTAWVVRSPEPAPVLDELDEAF